MKIESPVLFDASVIIGFKGQLKTILGFFNDVLIHETVFNEILDGSLKDELKVLLESSENIGLVYDINITDDITKAFQKTCDKELRNTFNIDCKRDLGEYKSLLYAKLNDVLLFATQDTTVWSFLHNSMYFNDIECMTLQDMAYLLNINSRNAENEKTARNLYRICSNTKEFPWNWFKKFIKNRKDILPNYIAYENNRIENYMELVLSYDNDSFSVGQIKCNILELAKKNYNSCISCIYSRKDPSNDDFSKRCCFHKFLFDNEKCKIIAEHFKEDINYRHR
ncbi:MAG: hypothetical protein JXQ23_08290 [Clostridia bacterium]|nr:hypothetical protein [Clostridia bacterium]